MCTLSSIVLYWLTFKIPHRKLSGTFFNCVVSFLGFPFIPGYFVSYSTLQLCLRSVCLGGLTFDVCPLERESPDGGSARIIKGTNLCYCLCTYHCYAFFCLDFRLDNADFKSQCSSYCSWLRHVTLFLSIETSQLVRNGCKYPSMHGNPEDYSAFMTVDYRNLVLTPCH
jgi:hypothetical protein